MEPDLRFLKGIPLVNGVFHQIDGFLYIELFHDIGTVRLNGAAADEKQVGTFPVRLSILSFCRRFTMRAGKREWSFIENFTLSLWL